MASAKHSIKPRQKGLVSVGGSHVMDCLAVSECSALSWPCSSAKLMPFAKTSATASSTSSGSSSSTNAVATAFSDILEEAVEGLTQVAAQMASKRVAEFVEDRSGLKAFAQAAGWLPTGSMSGSSSSSSSSSTGTNTNDPIYRLVSALGQEILANLQERFDTNSTSDTTEQDASTDSTQQDDTTDSTQQTDQVDDGTETES
jgi:hypothetical protein